MTSTKKTFYFKSNIYITFYLSISLMMNRGKIKKYIYNSIMIVRNNKFKKKITVQELKSVFHQWFGGIRAIQFHYVS